jgi:hypothetical protein
MTPEQICDVLVEQGIITKDAFRHDMYSLQSTDGQFVGVRHEAKEIISDPRVAMAVMEKLATIEIEAIGNPWWVAATKPGQPHKYSRVTGETLPAAITEAGAMALQEQNDGN